MDILNTAHVRTPHDDDDRARMNDEGCPNHPVPLQKSDDPKAHTMRADASSPLMRLVDAVLVRGGVTKPKSADEGDLISSIVA
jgi:hypothetical protein